MIKDFFAACAKSIKLLEFDQFETKIAALAKILQRKTLARIKGKLSWQ